MTVPRGQGPGIGSVDRRVLIPWLFKGIYENLSP